MASTVKRRPLPALVSLLALLALAALVWWRVLHRGDTSAAASCPTPSAAPTVSAAAALPPPSAVTVKVLNATTRGGIAGTARKNLGTLGFNVPGDAANDSAKNKVTGTAQIRYGPKGRTGATILRYYFPGASLRPIATSSATVVVALGPKFTRVASAATVKRALQADKIVLATPSPTPTPAPSGSATASC